MVGPDCVFTVTMVTPCWQLLRTAEEGPQVEKLYEINSEDEFDMVVGVKVKPDVKVGAHISSVQLQVGNASAAEQPRTEPEQKLRTGAPPSKTPWWPTCNSSEEEEVPWSEWKEGKERERVAEMTGGTTEARRMQPARMGHGQIAWRQLLAYEAASSQGRWKEFQERERERERALRATNPG